MRLGSSGCGEDMAMRVQLGVRLFPAPGFSLVKKEKEKKRKGKNNSTWFIHKVYSSARQYGYVCMCMYARVKSKHFHGIVSSNLAFFLPDCSINNARNKGENKRNKKKGGE